MRSQGLAIDNLLSAHVVTAEGRSLTASADEHADLFWGLRGGGGNFGVVTSFEYRLHAIPPVMMGGAAFYPIDALPDLLRFYRAWMSDASDALTVQCNVIVAPDAPFVPSPLRGELVAALAVCHAGSPDDARRDLQPLQDFRVPLLDRIRPMPYLTIQRLFDAAGAFGHHVHGRSGHLAALSDDAVTAIATHAPRMTSPLSITMISPLKGAVARVSADATAFAHRDAAFDLAISGVWDDAGHPERHVAWVEDFWEAVAPHTSGVYVNELGDEGRARVAEAYPDATYRRLVALKDRYDPHNVFRLNQNVIPTTQ
jgi:FAD/FMN-containing dehydrogenase